MSSVRTQHSWEAFLKFYSQQNKGRKTRLGVFARNDDVTNDYWIADGLDLLGIDMDADGSSPTIEVLLEGYSHSVANAQGLKVHFSLEGDEDGIDIIHSDRDTTVLRFEID